MKTSGHLSNNGGIRGHSAGTFFPFIVVAKGSLASIKWHVQSPDGSLSLGFTNVKSAHNLATAYYAEWCS